MKKITFKIEGVSPLLMHNGQTKNPLNKYAKAIKEISGKRKKTDDDFMKMSDIELEAGLYYDTDGKIYIPDINIEQTIINGAKKQKLGAQFKAGMSVESHMYLKNGQVYTKDKVLSEERYRFVIDVKIQRNSVMRTRPRFDEWNGEFTVLYNPDVINERDVIQAVEDAGKLVGIGDWRPRFGRFNIEEYN